MTIDKHLRFEILDLWKKIERTIRLKSVLELQQAVVQ